MDKEPYDILYDDRAKKKREHILFIGAHPDDIEISCGGTILKHIENGDLVVIMCMSNDRDDEFRRVYEGLNCKIEISSFKDKEVPFNTKSVEEIEEIIRKYNIDTIYTHNDFETHQDHINTHLASMSTSRLVRNVYLYEIVPLNRPYNSYMNINRYVDISDYIVDKLKLISKNTSQINKYRLRGENLLRRVFNLNNHRGDEINVNYAEGFHVVKEVIR
jgi:LmbE family N-acetylglucosaminyl deacetylase